jgi:hypothetical protein
MLAKHTNPVSLVDILSFGVDAHAAENTSSNILRQPKTETRSCYFIFGFSVRRVRQFWAQRSPRLSWPDHSRSEAVIKGNYREELYKTLLNKVRTTKAINALGADTEYWTQCANIVLRAKYEVLNK